MLEAQQALTQFRALCLTGPRQSGKTTLSKVLFEGKPYVNFENPTVQFEAEQNPEAFLKQFLNGAIFDEVQRVPHIFRYLQEILDNNTKRGNGTILLNPQVPSKFAINSTTLLACSIGVSLTTNLTSQRPLSVVVPPQYF